MGMTTEKNSLIRSVTVSKVVRRPAEAVYAFASDPDNLPAWAAGLVDGAVATDGDALILESPMGRIVVRFVPHNELGVLDHDVTTPSGATTNNPFRVISHPDGQSCCSPSDRSTSPTRSSSATSAPLARISSG